MCYVETKIDVLGMK